MNTPDSGKIIQVMQVVAGLIVMFLIYKIMTGLGLIKTGKKKEEEKQKEAAADGLRSSEYFDTTLILKKQPSYIPLGSMATQYAKDLRKALRGFGTDEEMIYAIFNRLKNKYQVSELSLAYKAEYKKDLLADIMNDLTDKEQVILWGIINKLN
jgi:hypothetical protein